MASAGGEWIHPGVSAQALAVLDGIVRYHPFVDGNKRTGVVAADLYLHDRGFVWRWDETSKFGFVIAMASGCGEVDELPGMVERMTLGSVFFYGEDRDLVLKALIFKNHELLLKLDEYDRIGGEGS